MTDHQTKGLLESGRAFEKLSEYARDTEARAWSAYADKLAADLPHETMTASGLRRFGWWVQNRFDDVRWKIADVLEAMAERLR